MLPGCEGPHSVYTKQCRTDTMKSIGEGLHVWSKPHVAQSISHAKFVLECTTSERLLSFPRRCKLLLLQHVHNLIAMIYLGQEQACQGFNVCKRFVRSVGQLPTCNFTSCLPDDVCLAKQQGTSALNLLSIIRLLDSIGCTVSTRIEFCFVVYVRI